MLEAVVFDFDGVIADTPEYYFKYIKKELQNLHKEITDEDISEMVGHSFSDKLDYIKSHYNLDLELNNFVEKISVPARKEIRETMEIDPFLEKLLIELKENQIDLAIASTNAKKNIDFILQKFDLEKFFSGVVTVEDVNRYKPFPDAYVKAIELLKKKPEHCVAIEDTLIGVTSAKEAGLKAIAMPNKYSKMQDFSKADLVVKSFKDLDFDKLRGLFK